MTQSTEATMAVNGTTPEESVRQPPARTPTPKRQRQRRFFLFTVMGNAWMALSAALIAMTLGSIRFLFPNVLAEPPSQFTVGPAAQFEPGVVDTRWKDEFQIWIVHLAEEHRLIALSTYCTHLGCAPIWLENEEKYKCPCHGSGFYKNGINFEGPAPRPLERFRIVEIDGVVVVDKSKKFQYELGQWDDPESYLPV